jgi:UDP-N-acetylglucosamine--N-acetylmuramyl-(pentapeptide) pyrophosphoryl-undecaprenol N-acetylglucosamine transferase
MLLIVTGPSGGHILPAKAVAQAWLDQGHSCHWIGREGSLEHQIADKMQINFDVIQAVNFRAIRIFNVLSMIKQLYHWVISVKSVIIRVQPKAVFLTGSYMTIVPGIICWFYNIPVVLHEQNAVMGYANRFLSCFSTLNIGAYPLKNIELVGNPVGYPTYKERFHQNLLIIGGSLGSAYLNQTLPELLKIYPQLKIKHICGKHQKKVEHLYQLRGINAEVISFSHDMLSLYEWADMVVCRAGAMTLAEITAHRLPALTVPLPNASQNHQYYNAKYFLDQQAILLSNQDQDSLRSGLKKLITDHDYRIYMMKMLHQLQTPNATQEITTLIKKVINDS